MGLCADAGGVLFRRAGIRQRELLSGHSGHHRRLTSAGGDRIPAPSQKGYIVEIGEERFLRFSKSIVCGVPSSF